MSGRFYVVVVVRLFDSIALLKVHHDEIRHFMAAFYVLAGRLRVQVPSS